MAVEITTDSVEIRRLLEPVLLADPVGNTVFGTIRGHLRAGGGGWCARDRDCLAVRSGTAHPVAVGAGWSNLPALAGALDELDELAGVGGPVAAIEELLGLLARPPAVRTDQRLYRLDTLREPKGVAGSARPAAETTST